MHEQDASYLGCVKAQKVKHVACIVCLQVSGSAKESHVPSWYLTLTHRLKKLLLLGGNRSNRSPEAICTSNHDQRGLREVEYLNLKSASCDDPLVVSKDLHLKTPWHCPPGPSRLSRICG